MFRSVVFRESKVGYIKVYVIGATGTWFYGRQFAEDLASGNFHTEQWWGTCCLREHL